MTTSLKLPETTAEKRIRRFINGVNWERVRLGAAQNKGRPQTLTIPALDVAALQARYHPDKAHLPEAHTATFQVPLGISEEHYERLKMEAVHKFVAWMDKVGYDLRAEYRIKVFKGMYPAIDLRDGIPLLDRREYMIEAWFCFRNPKPMRIELDPKEVNEITIKQPGN